MRIDIDRARFLATLEEQSEFGATDAGGLHRLTLSEADRAVRDWLIEQMEAAGLSTRIDAIGNMFGRRAGHDPGADPILVGSHLDSQPDGGRFDGALGVIAALEFIRTLNDHDIATRRPIEIVNWTNEEGSRFQPAMQGSGVWAGAHSLEAEYAKTDTDGTVLEDELERTGYLGEVPAEPAEDYSAYLELHIEQGPYLDEEDRDVGVVEGIVGISWGAITFSGEADHSGPTPMHYRHDALVGAADVITAIRRIPGMLGEKTVGTTGFVEVQPNSINVIPGEVTFTWGFRDPDDAVVDEAVDRVLAEAEAAAAREGLEWDWEERMRAPSVDFPDRPVSAVESAAEDLGYGTERLVSGAGHDATHVASVCDTAMVFAVSEGGKSHSEAEYTSPDDCYTAANTLANAALDLAEPIEP